MTGRWITVGLCALALAACHKKEAAKPPAPTAETPAAPPATPPAAPTTETPATPPADTTATTPETPPPAAVDPTGITPTPPPPGVTPTTTADAPPTFVPLKPIRVLPKAVIKLPPKNPGPTVTGGAGPDQAASQSAGGRPPPVGQRPPPIRIGKTAAQTKAEKDILGLWIEQKNRKDILNFTTDGAVAYREKITDTPKWTGHWKAGADGVVQFDLAMKGANGGLQFSAYPTAAQIMAIAPHWTKEWGGSGQYAYERMK